MEKFIVLPLENPTINIPTVIVHLHDSADGSHILNLITAFMIVFFNQDFNESWRVYDYANILLYQCGFSTRLLLIIKPVKVCAYFGVRKEFAFYVWTEISFVQWTFVSSFQHLARTGVAE